MIVAARVDVTRSEGPPLRLLVTAETPRRRGEPLIHHRAFEAPDMMPRPLTDATMSFAEFQRCDAALAAALAHELAAIAALPEPVRRLAEAAGLTAAEALRIYLDAGRP